VDGTAVTIRCVVNAAELSNVQPDPLSLQAIQRRFVHADLAMALARWILRSWHWLDPQQRAVLSYGLSGGVVGSGQVGFAVPLVSLLEAIDVLRRHPEPGEPE
jgi:hypothetical protein